MTNQNSFADNIAKLTENVNVAIETLNSVTDAIIGENDTVSVNLPNDTSINILSNRNIINRLNNVENTMQSFTSGNGIVKLVDGTHRKIKVSTIPQTPTKITNLNNITTFDINHNWFFEDLMFPRLIVKYDLKNSINDDSDRVKICRIIIDLSDKNADNIRNFYDVNIKDKSLSYNELINLLNYNNVLYYEDEEILNFPLYSNERFGKFVITKSEIINGKLYYYLDTIYTSSKNTENNNIKLSKNDKVKYNQSIYEIVNIDETYNRIEVNRHTGLDSINIGDIIEYYNDPFMEKIIEIPIGNNEINCIFFKGINEEYNLIADEWSDMISFISNDLKYEYDDSTLDAYYNSFVSDFGRDLIAQIKDKRVLAYNGITPNPVTLDKNNFRVVRINTQLNLTLDDDIVKNTKSQIDSLKSNIDALRKTISNQKYELLSAEDKTTLQASIDSNTSNLNMLIAEYSSNVEYLNSYLYENSASLTNPKYHIRGFFNIPEHQYLDQKNKIGKQEIIGFEVRYRYLKLNEVGTDLSTFSFADENGNTITAVYSDWNIYQTGIKEKTYNDETGMFEWVIENQADGNQININQIDIPITNGEKVEFMVRSISEAGYPNNPLKSKWSNSIIMSFPENLSNNNQIENILTDVKSEMTTIRLNDTLSSAGYYNHINDEIVINDNTQTSYHHNSKNILFIDDNNGTQYKSLYDKIIEMESRITELNAELVKSKNRITELENKNA